jgi:GT2 family glycosyltransferase
MVFLAYAAQAMIPSFLMPLCRRPRWLLFAEPDPAVEVVSAGRCVEASLAQPLSPGWYLIKPAAGMAAIEAFLHLDLGFGYEEAERIALNCINGVLSSSVALLPAGVKKMRLQVKADDDGGVTPGSLLFVPIFRAEAVARIAVYLYRLNKLRGISAAQILREKIQQIRKAGVVNIIKNLGNFYNYADTKGPLGYQQWIRKNERLDSQTRSLMQEGAFAHTPLISFVCPAGHDLAPLGATLDSLRRQAYGHWHLLVVIGEATPPEMVEYLHQAAAGDDRIGVFAAPEDPDVAARQSAVPLLKGDFALWLTAGDCLSSYALSYWLGAINQRPEVVAWYADTDHLDAGGQRRTPHFRPAWNRELFYSQDYIGPCCLVQLAAMRAAAGAAPLTSRVELYDLLLRLVESGEEARIGHVAKVLCHHAAEPGAAPGQHAARQQALQDHLDRLGRQVVVEPGLLPGSLRLVYPLPASLPTVTLVIPSRDQVKILQACIDSIVRRTTYPAYEILVMDNGSVEQATRRYLQKIQTEQGVRVAAYDLPFNFAAINNAAVRLTETDMICLLNNDIEVVSPDWLGEMVRHAARPEVGCVGAKLLYGNNTVQHAGVICGLGNVAGHAHRYLAKDAPGYWGRLQVVQYYSAVTAACLLVRRTVWDEVAGMNEELAVAYNDVDFCLRLQRAGYHTVYTPYAELYHHESLSRGAEDSPAKQERYQREVAYMWRHWPAELANDRCYNPNLSRLREDFSL